MCSQKQIDELSRIRGQLLIQMQELGKKDLNCVGCAAPCCTFHHNSMRITLTEGIVLVNYLHSQAIDLTDIAEKCHATIQEYRLDKELFIKSGVRLRRHYTCFFFTNRELGCSIPAEYKPLGCLAFNPTEPSGKGQTCRSMSYPEFCDGEKLEIPQMLLKVLQNFSGVL
ncbi:MAG: hypothetical protein HYV97_01650 [Bdellovibrio sp.]|nr:hypothetical protein [Bdellovibrio sp.]